MRPWHVRTCSATLQILLPLMECMHVVSERLREPPSSCDFFGLRHDHRMLQLGSQVTHYAAVCHTTL